MKRRLHATVLIGLLLVALPASAVWWWVPTLVDGAIWLGSVAANNYRVWKIAEVTSAGMAGAVLTDMYLSSKDDASSGGNTSARVDVRLAPSAKRENPDPATWNDAPPGQIDPVRKTAVSVPTVGNGGVPYGGADVTINNGLLTVTASHSVTTRADSGYPNGIYAGFPGARTQVNSYGVTYSYPSLPVTGPATIDGKTITYSEFLNTYVKTWINRESTLRFYWFVQILELPEAYKTAYGDSVVPSGKWEYAGAWSCYDERGMCLFKETSVGGYPYPDINIKSDDFSPDRYNRYVEFHVQPYLIKSGLPDPVPVGQKFADVKNAVAIENIGDRKYAIHSITTDVLCSSGQVYNVASKNCVTTAATKPPTTPCQIVYHGGMWQTDAANPNCDQVTINHVVSGNIAQVQIGDERAEIEVRADGSRRMTWHDGKRWRTVETGPCTSDGCVESALTDSDTGSFTPIGQNPGSGQGGSCGGPTQPKCFIDDSGFDGKNQAIRDKMGEGESFLDAQKSGLEGKGSELAGQDHGWSSTWLPKLWPDPVQCEPLILTMGFDHGPLAGLTASAPIEFCEQAASIKSFFAWLFYLGGVVYIWRTFIGSNGGGKK